MSDTLNDPHTREGEHITCNGYGGVVLAVGSLAELVRNVTLQFMYKQS